MELKKIRFGLSDYETTFPEWARHHPELSIHVRREYPDGTSADVKDPKLLSIIEKHSDQLITANNTIYKNDQFIEVIDYYLPLQNLDYQTVNVPYYSNGSMNTEQTTYFRMIFQIEYSRCILDSKFTSSGLHAITFADMFTFDSIAEMIQEIAEHSRGLEYDGIMKMDNIDGYYQIVVADENKRPIDIEIEERELVNSLIGIEIYQFDQKITD